MRAQDQAFDQLLASSPQLLASVEAIESLASRLLPDGGHPHSMAHTGLFEGSELSAGQVVSDVEEFLRAQRS
jgi:hypothetical protein